jgi:hypothetical protein
MGKLKEIRKDFAELKANVKLLAEKAEKFDEIEETVKEFSTKFNDLYKNYFLPDPEITPEQIKQQEEAALEQMKGVIQSAIVDMVNKPENQKAISDFAGQFAGAMSGKGQGGWADLMTEDGQVNWGIAIQQFMNKQNKGSPVVQTTTRGRKTTAY